MIGVTLEGRLGNQLFQYAFAYAQSKKLETDYFIDIHLEEFLLPNYFTLESSAINFLSRYLFNIKGFKNVFRINARRIFGNALKCCLFKHTRSYRFDEHPNEILKDIYNQTLYVGFFQSEIYFQHYEKEIRDLFTIRQKVQKKYNGKFGQLFGGNKIVSVHIRKTDYTCLGHLNLGNSDLSLPFSYYHKIIKGLEEKDLFFVFTSDDPSCIEEEFAYIQNKYISFGDEITDFQHMMNADICITSNSTFSWWSAYLNKKQGKVVYCPKYFLGLYINKTIPLEIYSKAWIQVDVK